MKSYFYKQLRYTHIFLVTLLFISGNLFSQTISGPTSVTAGQPVDYSYYAEYIVMSPKWSVNGTTYRALVPSGSTYYITTVTWTTPGTGTLSFLSGTQVLATLTVTVKPPPTLSSTLLAPAICSGATFSYTPTSSTSGATFSWSRAAVNGISQAAASGSGNVNETLTNTTSSAINVTYAYTVTAPDGGSGVQNVVVAVNPVSAPALSSSLNPVGICSGSTFAYTPTSSTSGSTFSWSRPLVAGISQAAASGTGSVSEVLTNTTASPVSVTYAYTITANACSRVQNVVVIINPSPAVGGSNISRCGAGSVTLNTLVPQGFSVRWYSALTGSSLISLGSSITQTISTTTNYYVTATDDATGCETNPRYARTATINPIPAAPSVTQNMRIGPGSLSLVASGAPTGGVYNWYSAITGGTLLFTGGTYSTPPVSSSTTNYVYTEISTPSAGCFSTRTPVNVTLLDVPMIQTPSPYLAKGSSIQLTSSITAAGYVWKDSTGTTLSTSPTCTVSKTGNYTLTVTLSGLTYTTPPFVVGKQLAGLETMNYIITNKVMQAGVMNDTRLLSMPVDSVNQSIAYLDGFGRPLQTVTTQGSPFKKDIVQPFGYDVFGREFRHYLPFVPNENNGRYKSGVINQDGSLAGSALAFYANGPTDKVIDDTRPFSETTFESTPLNRPVNDLGPGQDWNAANKAVAHQYVLNNSATEQIIAWIIDPYSGLPVPSPPSADVLAGGYYVTGQLSIKSTKDEQGHEVREYTDKRGHLILKKVQAAETAPLNDSTKWAHTYYIYNQLDQLVLVLSPEAVKAITN